MGNVNIASVRQCYLIYADNLIKWNKEKDDWDNNDEFTGTYLDAHEYARKKYGKYYTINAA